MDIHMMGGTHRLSHSLIPLWDGLSCLVCLFSTSQPVLTAVDRCNSSVKNTSDWWQYSTILLRSYSISYFAVPAVHILFNQDATLMFESCFDNFLVILPFLCELKILLNFILTQCILADSFPKTPYLHSPISLGASLPLPCSRAQRQLQRFKPTTLGPLAC